MRLINISVSIISRISSKRCGINALGGVGVSSWRVYISGKRKWRSMSGRQPVGSGGDGINALAT